MEPELSVARTGDQPRDRVTELLGEYLGIFPGRQNEAETYHRPLLAEVVGLVGPKAFRRACLRAKEDEGEFVGLGKIVSTIQYPPEDYYDSFPPTHEKSWRAILAAGAVERLGPAAAPAQLPERTEEPGLGQDDREGLLAHIAHVKRMVGGVFAEARSESADQRTRRLAGEALREIERQQSSGIARDEWIAGIRAKEAT